MWGSVELLKKNFLRLGSSRPRQILGEARYRKSAAEIDYIRKGTEIAQIALDALRRRARGCRRAANLRRNDVCQRERRRHVPRPIGWCSGPQGHVYHRIAQPSFRKLQRGDAMLLEIEGRWGGYVAKSTRPSWSASHAKPEMVEGMKLTLEAFERVRTKMAPGVRIAELIAVASLKSNNGRIETGLGFHGRGTGNDGPLLVAFRKEPQEVLDIEIEEDCSFIIKPSAKIEGIEDCTRWGDSVVVTSRGAERLGARIPELIVQR